jgi:hypothetical protein
MDPVDDVDKELPTTIKLQDPCTEGRRIGKGLRIMEGENDMKKGKVAGLLALISTAFLICACGLLPKFTVHLPDRTVEIEIPGTGKILDKTDFDDYEVIRGSGDMVTVERVVNDFDRISVMGSGDITLTQGEKQSLVVTLDDNLLDYLQTEVESGTLVLGFDPEKARRKDLRPSESIHFEITVPDLSEIAIYGSADVKSKGLELDRFSMDIYGSGDIEVDQMRCSRVSMKVMGIGDIEIDDLEAQVLEVSIPGKGTVRLVGVVEEQDVDLPGFGHYRAGKLQSQFAYISIPGMGDATVWVTDKLYADILGSGDIEYFGDPQIYHTGLGSGDLIGIGNP